MKIKKYLAKTMPEAMQQIRKELGSDAVILQSKEIKKGGVLGLFKNKRIEVVAALDPTPPENDQEHKPTKVEPLNMKSPVMPRNQTNDQEVLKEIQYLKELVEQQAVHANHNLPPLYELTRQYLLKQEVDGAIADSLLDDISEYAETHPITSKPEMKLALEDILNQQLDAAIAKTFDNNKQIIQFVGPTGVGKTTTLAKVAAKTILKEEKQVALITMDTYRIAAIDQLKTYARILNAPIEVAYTFEDYKQALQKFQQYDYIFVDTAGRNFRNPQYVQELKQMLTIEEKRVETVLVLALTAKAQDTTDIYNQFEPLGIKKVIFTKLDETLTYGSIFNICLGKEKQILHVTNGQNVPDDLLTPPKSRLIQLLLSGYTDD